MKKPPQLGKIPLALFALLTCGFGQTERWLYRYNGRAGRYDCAERVVYGTDGNIYAAGWGCEKIAYEDDVLVISLSSNGGVRWLYCYNGPEESSDRASSLVYGGDSNIYIVGSSLGNYLDLLVVSLTPTGDERWVYRYDGGGGDWATSVVYGDDGNIYVAGGSEGDSFLPDCIIISLTPNGEERWVYRYHGENALLSIVYGGDGNIYAGGPIVVSLTPDGTERWVKSFGGVVSVVYGLDGNIYVGGHACSALGGYYDIRVLSLTSEGNQRWLYSYDDPIWHWADKMRALVYGSDGNLYLAGTSYNADGYFDTSAQVVISLRTDGTERWIFRYTGGDEGKPWNEANSLVYGSNDNIYIAGYRSRVLGYDADVAVINLTPEGEKRWVYYGCPGVANSVVYGAEGNIYACGSDNDFLVFSIDPVIGVEEAFMLNKYWTDELVVQPNPARDVVQICYRVPENVTPTLRVYNTEGCVVHSTTGKSGIFILKELPMGVYVVRLEGTGRKAEKKFVIVK